MTFRHLLPLFGDRRYGPLLAGLERSGRLPAPLVRAKREAGLAVGPQSSAAPPGASPAPGLRRPLPCVHLGAYVRRVHSACGRNHVRRCDCDAGHGDVSQNGFCETCPDYEAD